MNIKKELIDQSAHFAIGAAATIALYFVWDNIWIAALIVAVVAVGREIYQRLKKGNKWNDCGPGCMLDLLFWALGISLTVGLKLSGVL